MKVLHITNNYPTTKYPIFGIFVKEQIESLSNQIIENELFFINGRENGKVEYLKSIFRIRKILHNNHFEVIHCHHAFSALCLILSGYSRKNKTIVSYQSDPVNELGTVLYRFIENHVSVVILKTKSILVNNQNVFYLPNGVNISLFKSIDKTASCKILNLDPSKKYILFVSSNFIRKEKRYDKFIDTLEIIKKKYQMEDVEELKLINTKRELVPYYYNAASLHLLTSDFEGSPNSVKEAMACNIPVVSTNVGNVSIMLDGIKGSYVARLNTPEELAELSHQILISNEVCKSRDALINKKLDMDSVAKQLVALYNKALQQVSKK